MNEKLVIKYVLRLIMEESGVKLMQFIRSVCSYILHYKNIAYNMLQSYLKV